MVIFDLCQTATDSSHLQICDYYYHYFELFFEEQMPLVKVEALLKRQRQDQEQEKARAAG